MRLCPGCYRPIPTTGRCAVCRKAKERERGTRQQRGYDESWVRLSRRAIVLQPWCSRCGSGHDLTVDHIDPKTKHQYLILNQVQVLCRSCNSSKGGGTGTVEARGAREPRPKFSRSTRLGVE